MSILSDILDYYSDEEFLTADGFDDCVVGVDCRSMRLIYSETLILESLVLQGMSVEEAIEHYEYNIQGAYMGEKTPIYLTSFTTY